MSQFASSNCNTFFVVLLLMAAASCGEDGSDPGAAPDDDTAAAYEALAASREACDDELAACAAAAAGDAAKLAACQSANAACTQKTATAEKHAQDSLQRHAESCWKRCRSDDDAGAVTDGGPGDMHGCIEHHAPKLPKCVGELFSCLSDAGLRSHDATREEIAACVHSAHMCFREGLSQRRGARAGDDDDQGDDGDQQRSRFGRRGRH